jgi:peptide chain release factor subunit 1
MPGRAESVLQQLAPLTDDESLGHDAKMSVRGDLDRIGLAAKESRFPAGGVAFFSCSAADFFEEVTLPRAVHDRVMVDETPWVRPLFAVLDEYRRAGVVIVDRATAQLWNLYGDELEEDARIRDPKLRTRNAAGGWQGWREQAVQNQAADLAKKHYRHVADVLRAHGGGHRYDVLIVGGHAEEIPSFLDHLPRDLRRIVIGTFEVDPGTVDRGVVKEQAGRILEQYERQQERQWVDEVLERVAEGRPAAIGLRQTLWAASMAAIQDLLVQEDVLQPGVACDNCGWLGLSGEGCPVCGSTLRHTPDVIDELVEAVIDEGGSVRHVGVDTELRRHVAGAILRFPLPPQP